VKNRSFYRVLFLIVIAVTLFFQPSIAQRDRRKKVPDGQPSEMRLREAEFFFTEGEKYYILEDYAKALKNFQYVIDLNPENPTVHYKIAEILVKSQKEEDLLKASASIENALSLEKKNKYFFLLASNIYTALNNYAKAEQSLESMMKEIRGCDEYLYELAAIYQYDHKPEEALKVYNRAEGIMGINEVSSLQKQKIYLEQGKVNEAIAEGQKLLAANPDEERYVMGFAEILAQKGQQKKAVEAIENYVSSHPHAGSAKILLAGFYREGGQEKKAREILTEAFNDASIDMGSKIIVLGTYTAQIGKNRAKQISDPETEGFTLDLFNQLRKSYDDDPNVHIAGGDLYVALKRPADAEHEYLSAVQHGSTTFEAWQNLLSLQAEHNKFDSLIFYSEQGLELFPNQSMLYYLNGYGNMRRGHYRQAAASLEQAKKLSSGNASFVNDINGMLGDAYNGTKEYAKSDKAYDDALSFNPNNDYVLNNYSYYLALRKENLEKAERMASQASKNQPNNSSFLDTYAWVLYAREKYKEARKVIEKAIGQPNVNSTLFEHYGDILFQLGDVEGAVKQWEKARSMTSQHDLIDKKIANRRVY
jgi:tetratricopeptide (TPR) repeat protein